MALAVALIAGCGGGSSPAPPAPTATRAARTPAPSPQGPVLCDRLRARTVGRVDAGAGSELSGLVQSRARPDLLWTHDDSGGTPQVLSINRTGSLRSAVTLTGAENIDWEDIAMRGKTLYVGDIGDNLAQRPEIAVYRFGEPGAGVTSVAAERITLRYPDGGHDAEALLVDPRGGTIVIVTKDYGGVAGVYVAAGGRLRRAGTLELGSGQAITAGDVSADGRVIALRSYGRAFVWARRSGESLARALRRAPCVAAANLLYERQGEALALTRDGRAFYTVPEGLNPRLRRYGR